MFIDTTKIKVKAGHGGSGSMSFYRAKFVPKGGPDGGDGGKGGNVILVASHSESSLVDLRFQPNWKAERGEDGSGRQKHGKNGADCRVKVPLGTLVFDVETDQLLCDLTEDGQEFVAARGGKGGLGNLHFVSSTNRTPRQYTPGTEGEEFELELELKLIADIGLVGFPNAGKSTILGAISNAHPKVAPYPFTTLTANVGIVESKDFRFRRMTVADIPGIIEGAHENVGLGEAFLRHIERCRMYCYVLDMAGTDGRSPLDDLRVLRSEIHDYDEAMAKRPYIIVANKMDMPESEENMRLLKESEPEGTIIVPICAELSEGVPELLDILWEQLDKVPPEDEAVKRHILARHHRELKSPAALRGDAFDGWE